jgi:hypothetical protein
VRRKRAKFEQEKADDNRGEYISVRGCVGSAADAMVQKAKKR